MRQPVAKEENSSENTDNGKDIDEYNEFKKSFVNKEHVALHARYAHLEKGIIKKHRASNHLNKDSEKVTLPCDHCDFKSMNKSSLEDHIKFKHPSNINIESRPMASPM